MKIHTQGVCRFGKFYTSSQQSGTGVEFVVYRIPAECTKFQSLEYLSTLLIVNPNTNYITKSIRTDYCLTLHKFLFFLNKKNLLQKLNVDSRQLPCPKIKIVFQVLHVIWLYTGNDNRSETLLIPFFHYEIVQKSFIITGDMSRVRWLEKGAKNETKTGIELYIFLSPYISFQ